MARPSKRQSLLVWMNGERVGKWIAAPNEAQEFSYDAEWITARNARPISLSMPLGPEGTTYKGPVVERFFENLLPDNKEIRERIRQRFNTKSGRAFDLLAEIGRDCVGAIQLTTEDEAPPDVRKIDGDLIDETDIERLLDRTLGGPTLGRNDDDVDWDFRISLAGAQEKTALLRIDEQWLRPKGATPTTHILKLPIGEGPQGIDLTMSVEIEWLCAQILRAYGVDTAHCWMDRFGDYKVLVVERFDRRLSADGRWIARIPQEDLCQATGTDRESKYQADGGPGIKTVMDLLLGSGQAGQDRREFFRTQILFWMLCAIDGHAKNFSVFLEPQGRFRLTPRYDVLSAFPVLGKKAGQLSPHKVKMAMAVQGEKNRHYHWDSIFRRHWQSTARHCGMATQFDPLINEIVENTPRVIAEIEAGLPDNFPASVAAPVLKGLSASSKRLML
jgi:serine/threonine-protein kinase HipA